MAHRISHFETHCRCMFQDILWQHVTLQNAFCMRQSSLYFQKLAIYDSQKWYTTNCGANAVLKGKYRER